MTTVRVDEILLDSACQPRTEINGFTVDEYAEAIEHGDDFPPVIVFRDSEGLLWCADGFHRVAAYAKAGRDEIPAKVRKGEKRDAILFSVGANADHGLRRTNQDKRRAVLALLVDGEWRQWSDSEIARRCRVSHPFVAKTRGSLETFSSERRKRVDKHGNVSLIDTSNIGKRNARAAMQAGADLAEANVDEDEAAELTTTLIDTNPSAVRKQVAEHYSQRAEEKRAKRAEEQAAAAAAAGELPREITLLKTTIEQADLASGTFDLVVTDPPYGVSQGAADIGSLPRTSIPRDFGEWDKGDFPLIEWAERIAGAMKPGASLYLFTADDLTEPWKLALIRAGLTWRQMLVWSKTNPAPQFRQKSWTSAAEFILYLTKGKERIAFNWQGEEHMRSVIPHPIVGNHHRIGHPTEKPVDLAERLISVSGVAGGRLLDPFAGSGAIGAAALRCGMSATLVEPEPEFQQMIEARMALLQETNR